MIDPLTGNWDEALVNSVFSTVDANRILKFPLSTNGFDDFVAWHYNHSGTFSVRSAYHVEWKHQFGNMSHQMASSLSGSNPIWKKIWSLVVPGKVKLFCWRALHVVLSPKSILMNHHIGMEGDCPICRMHPEDIKHQLFGCTPAQKSVEAFESG